MLTLRPPSAARQYKQSWSWLTTKAEALQSVTAASEARAGPGGPSITGCQWECDVWFYPAGRLQDALTACHYTFSPMKEAPAVMDSELLSPSDSVYSQTLCCHHWTTRLICLWALCRPGSKLSSGLSGSSSLWIRSNNPQIRPQGLTLVFLWWSSDRRAQGFYWSVSDQVQRPKPLLGDCGPTIRIFWSRSDSDILWLVDIFIHREKTKRNQPASENNYGAFPWLIFTFCVKAQKQLFKEIYWYIDMWINHPHQSHSSITQCLNKREFIKSSHMNESRNQRWSSLNSESGDDNVTLETWTCWCDNDETLWVFTQVCEWAAAVFSLSPNPNSERGLPVLSWNIQRNPGTRIQELSERELKYWTFVIC